jgi:hypothetical protein
MQLVTNVLLFSRILWVATPRRFGGRYHFLLQGRKISQARNQSGSRPQCKHWTCRIGFLLGSILILKMEALYYSETLGCENIKSNVLFVMLFMQFLKCTPSLQSLVFYFAAEFLPTFGPAFINLYDSANRSTLCSALLPTSEYGEAYRGRLLLAVKTETLGRCATSSQTEPAMRRVTRQPAISLIEVSKRFINGVRYFIA